LQHTGQLNSRTIFGIGVNDVPDAIGSKLYTVWSSMLRRCYSEIYQKNKPSYKEFSVCEQWLKLSGFREWFIDNYLEGFELDKDILIPTARIYSPETCCFVPREVNSLLIARNGKGGKLGVYYKTKNKAWCAQVQNPITKKNQYLGLFLDEHSASQAYYKAKQIILDHYADKYNEVLPAKVTESLRKYFKEF